MVRTDSREQKLDVFMQPKQKSSTTSLKQVGENIVDATCAEGEDRYLHPAFLMDVKRYSKIFVFQHQ